MKYICHFRRLKNYNENKTNIQKSNLNEKKKSSANHQCNLMIEILCLILKQVRKVTWKKQRVYNQ